MRIIWANGVAPEIAGQQRIIIFHHRVVFFGNHLPPKANDPLGAKSCTRVIIAAITYTIYPRLSGVVQYFKLDEAIPTTALRSKYMCPSMSSWCTKIHLPQWLLSQLFAPACRQCRMKSSYCSLHDLKAHAVRTMSVRVASSHAAPENIHQEKRPIDMPVRTRDGKKMMFCSITSAVEYCLAWVHAKKPSCVLRARVEHKSIVSSLHWSSIASLEACALQWSCFVQNSYLKFLVCKLNIVRLKLNLGKKHSKNKKNVLLVDQQYCPFFMWLKISFSCTIQKKNVAVSLIKNDFRKCDLNDLIKWSKMCLLITFRFNLSEWWHSLICEGWQPDLFSSSCWYIRVKMIWRLLQQRDFGFIFFLVPTAFILGKAERFVDQGSTINLTCIVVTSPVPPEALPWYHNGRVSTVKTFLETCVIKNFRATFTCSLS